MESIESSKENVRPLRSGRKIDCLVNSLSSKVEIESQKNEFENRLQQLSGMELLNTYYEYIIWIEQNYSSTDETMLKSVLERCLDHFFTSNDKQLYMNDKKLLSVFLKHTSMCNNPLEFFKSAYQSGFFKKIAQFFIEWSFHYEVFNDMTHAIKVLQGGLNKKAVPLESLSEAIRKLNQRKNEYESNPETVPTGDHRQAFNQLKVRIGNYGQGLAPVDRVNNVITNPIQNRGLRLHGSCIDAGQQKASTSSKQIRTDTQENFIVLNENSQDENEEFEEGPINLPFEKQAIPQSIKGNENMIKPGKWHENALKGNSKTSSIVKKEGFKVLNEVITKPKKEIKPEKPVDYSIFSWSSIASQICSTTNELCFEEIRYEKWKQLRSKRMSVQEKNSDFEDDRFLVPKDVFTVPAVKKISKEKNKETRPVKIIDEGMKTLEKNTSKQFDDGLGALESVESPLRDEKLVTPTELLNATVDRNLHKTLDFTISNFKTEDFSPCFGSTPQISRMKSFLPNNLSPLIEVSYKSSSSSGAYTTTASTNETDKSLPPLHELYEYPFKLRSIKFMLKSLKNPIELLPSYHYKNSSTCLKTKISLKNGIGGDFKIPSMFQIGQDSFLCLTNDSFYSFSDVDFIYCHKLSSKNAGHLKMLRLLDNGQWDFYIRNEVFKRSSQTNPLLPGLFMNEVHFYTNVSISIDDYCMFFNLKEFSFEEFPIISAFFIYEFVNFIEQLHLMKIVCGKVDIANIFIKKLNNIEEAKKPFFEILNFSSAVDFSIIPENCVNALHFQRMDWLGLLQTVCSMLIQDDIESQSLNFKLEALDQLSGKGARNVFMPKLGKILARMFKHIFQTKTELDLTTFKEELVSFTNTSEILLNCELDLFQFPVYKTILNIS